MGRNLADLGVIELGHAPTGTLPRDYSYDAAGNTTGYAGAAFTYDNRGRMVTATYGPYAVSYTYNALGQRVKRMGPTGTTLYVYDEAGHLLGEYDGAGSLMQETVWLGDIPVATLRPNGASIDVYYVHTDHLNTPRLITQPANNAERWRWHSDPFGTALPDENPAGQGVFKYDLRFPGQLYDGLVGLHYNYFRDYDPATGRHVESDPIGLAGGITTYAYVDNIPTLLADPNGLCPWCLVIPAVCSGGGCEAAAAALGLAGILSTPAGQEVAKDAAAAATSAAQCGNSDDDPCDKVLDRGLLRRAGLSGREHQAKADALGTKKSLSLFDLCGCNDGRVVVKAHGCKGPIISETDYRWK